MSVLAGANIGKRFGSNKRFYPNLYFLPHIWTKMSIFASSESTTLPVRTAYQGGTFLFIATMKYNKQPLDIPAQIAMLKGRGLNIVDEQAAEKTLSRISYFL